MIEDVTPSDIPINNPNIILIDDLRNINTGIICRDAEIGKKIIIALPKFDIMLLDNDLGDGKADGFTIMDWFEHPDNRHKLPTWLRCVSANPKGVARINQVARRLYQQVTRIDDKYTFTDPIGPDDELIRENLY